jgi:hypothetical protein
MTWWGWCLVFAGLLLGASFVGFVQLRTLWHKTSGLLAEVGTAAGLLGQLSDRLSELEVPHQAAPPHLAVFDDPAALRRARDRDRDIQSRVRRGRAAARRQTPR